MKILLQDFCFLKQSLSKDSNQRFYQNRYSFDLYSLVVSENIINSISNPSILEIDKPVSEEILQIRKLLESSIDEMELSVRSHNCLEAAGITLIGELVDKDEAEMLEYKNFGRKSLNELIEKLETMGLKFGMDTSPYTEDEA